MDDYDDIFSDFDPRPYSERALSDDFIAQVRKLTWEKDNKNLILQLLLPDSQRNLKKEEIIAERLPHHFHKNYLQLQLERKISRSKGLKLSGFGIVFMFIGGYISFQEPNEFWVHLLIIIFEPAGWFLFWSGLDILLEYSGKPLQELKFYSRMSCIKIRFGSY